MLKLFQRHLCEDMQIWDNSIFSMLIFSILMLFLVKVLFYFFSVLYRVNGSLTMLGRVVVLKLDLCPFRFIISRFLPDSYSPNIIYQSQWYRQQKCKLLQSTIVLCHCKYWSRALAVNTSLEIILPMDSRWDMEMDPWVVEQLLSWITPESYGKGYWCCLHFKYGSDMIKTQVSSSSLPILLWLTLQRYSVISSLHMGL